MAEEVNLPNVKEVRLVSISEYARQYKLDRHTVYAMIYSGRVTKYVLEDEKVMLDLNEKPKDVKPYKDREGYPESVKKED